MTYKRQPLWGRDVKIILNPHGNLQLPVTHIVKALERDKTCVYKRLDVGCHVHVIACARKSYVSVGTTASYNPRCRVEAWRPPVVPMSWMN